MQTQIKEAEQCLTRESPICKQAARKCLAAQERGHSCPPASCTLSGGQECPRSSSCDQPALSRNSRICSEAARIIVDELPREAFGVRPACWSCRKAGAVRKREQAPRTPNASRSSVAPLPGCVDCGYQLMGM